MASSPMKQLAPRVYVAGPSHLHRGLVLWLGPKRPSPHSWKLPAWRRWHYRHARLPLPAWLIMRLWPDA